MNNQPSSTTMSLATIAAIFAVTSAVPMDVFAAGQLPLGNPELKSRGVLWSEFDGSFLIDPENRAEVVDFVNTVMLAPYPQPAWSGSRATLNAGAIAADYRQREYAQLNAYRALSGVAPVSEDSSKLPMVQSTAFVMLLNQRISHTIDTSWIGYTAAAAEGAIKSNLGGVAFPVTTEYGGAVDAHVRDPGANNVQFVGHRRSLMNATLSMVALGAAGDANPSLGFNAMMPVGQPEPVANLPREQFVAFPSPGYFPASLEGPNFEPNALRWSFSPATDYLEWHHLNAAVEARINGRVAFVKNLLDAGRGGLTWEFSRADLDMSKVSEDTKIQITVKGFVVRGQAMTYSYVVTVMADQIIKQVPIPQTTSELAALSTRGIIGEGEKVLIGGFVIGGNLPVKVAFRGQGPGLAKLGVQNPAQKLHIDLYDSTNKVIGGNTNWQQGKNWRLLASYNLTPSEKDEPALVATLWPGAYTAVLSGAGEGVGIIEAYVVDGESASKLTALSTRGVVGSGERQMIAGVIIQNQPRTVMIRGQGPGLKQLGVNGAAGDIKLKIVRSDGMVVAENDDWETGSAAARIKGDLAAFRPTDAREPVIVINLPVGAYTALLESKNGEGVAIVEVYDVPTT